MSTLKTGDIVRLMSVSETGHPLRSNATTFWTWGGPLMMSDDVAIVLIVTTFDHSTCPIEPMCCVLIGTGIIGWLSSMVLVPA